MTSTKQEVIYIPLMAGILILAYIFYQQAFHAPWFFDDAPSLSGLAHVNDLDTAWVFVWEGISSQFGRPLSNLLFLINLGDWPQNPAAFRQLNTLLHLINGLLLAWLALRAAKLTPALANHRTAFSLILASLWLMQPILFTSTLMPVQRMTLLAGSFTLAGLLLYTIGRERMMGDEWRSGLIISSIGLMTGAVVGVLAKENAALTPFFALALEFTAFRALSNKTPNTIWNAWRIVFFAMPGLFLLIYIIYGWDGMLKTYSMRNFTMGERVASELVFLFDYLRQTILPDVRNFGPFHDDVKIYQPISPQVLFAGISWLILLTISIAIRRKIWPPLFALTWFLSGHLIESTLFPLELYFEHRNYIPIIGPLAVLTGWAITSRFRLGFLPWLLLAISCFATWKISSFWSDPVTAGEMSIAYQPHSPRAAQFLAIEYYRLGDREAAYKVIDQAANRMPYASDLMTTRLQLSCNQQNPELIQNAYEKVMQSAHSFESSFAVGDALYKIKNHLADQTCPSLSIDKFLLLTDALIHSPKIAANSLLMHHLHHIRADVSLLNNRPDLAIYEMKLAFKYAMNPETAMLISALLLKQGKAHEAHLFLNDSIDKLPATVLRRRDDWRSEVNKLHQLICNDSRSMCER